jgi:uncharacterized protein YecT (DUF1311 family)
MQHQRWLVLGVAVAALVSPAFGFDCKKAATPSEKAICADPAARAADAAMAQAFAALLALQSASAKPTVIAAQARWIRDRDNACADANKRGACLAEQSVRRRAFLAAEPEAGPGAPGRLEPFFRYDKGGKGRAAISLQLLKYPAPATPGERAFNAAVERLVGSLDQPEKDDPAPERYEHDRTMTLPYASPRLVSAHLEGYDDIGGAHPASFSGNVNLDVERGREAQFSDLLDARGAKAVFGLCEKAVIAQKKQREGADAPLAAEDLKQLAENVAAATGKLENWSFGPEKATIGYDAYAVGAYAEGAFDCEISYATLKALAKPGFPSP